MAETIDQLIEEMQAMRARLSGDAGTGDAAAAMAALDQAVAVLSDPTADATSEVVAPQPIAEIPPYTIVADAPGAPDNLTLIRGISSATAYALSGFGITRFAHVAGFTARDIAQLQEDLGYRCTVHRDNWIEQAAILAAGGSTSFSRRGAPLENAFAKPDIAVAPPLEAVVAAPGSASEAVEPALTGAEPELVEFVAEPEIPTPVELDESSIVEESPAGIVATPAATSGANIGTTSALLGSLAAAAALDRLDQDAEEPAAGSEPEPLIADTTVDAIVDDSVRETVVEPFTPIDLTEAPAEPIATDAQIEFVAASEEVLLESPEPDLADIDPAETTTAGAPVELQDFAPIALNQDEMAPDIQELAEELDNQPEPLIEEPVVTESGDEVFATLPEPVAVVPLEQEVSAPITEDPAMTGLLVSGAPEGASDVEPEPIPTPAPVEEPLPIALDTLPSAPEVEPPVEHAPLIAGQEDLAEIGDAVRDEERATEIPTFPSPPIVDTPKPITTEVAMEAPLDYAPGAPVFAPIIGGAASPGDGRDDVEIKITQHDDDVSPPPEEIPPNGSNNRPGLLDRVRAASGAVLANGAAHDAQPEPPQELKPPATIDPLPEPFSPHRTAVDEAEIIIVRDGEPEKLDVDVPPIEPRDIGLAGKLASVFRRKS